MIAPLTPAARPKAPQGKDAVDKQSALFNLQMAEQAELERERQAMEAFMLACIKNEDAIMKKWIEMI